MRLIDHYRRFSDPPREEVTRALREQRRQRELARRRSALVDLSKTTSPALPDTEIVNAAIAVARTRINAEPDPEGASVREAAAAHHGVGVEQIAAGNGAAELLKAATRALLDPGDNLVSAWPSYAGYPALAGDAGGELVTVPATDVASEPHELAAAVTERTRAIVVCNPNDPTGDYIDSERLASLLGAVPERNFVFLDEALVHYQDREPLDAAVRLIDRFPNLLIFRSFSKIYGLSGLRGGYAIGARETDGLLRSLAPALGVNAVTQAAMTHALERGQDEVSRQRSHVISQRERLLRALSEIPGVTARPSQANLVWLRAHELDGDGLAERLLRHGIKVASGKAAGDRDHVRVTVKDNAASERLLEALAVPRKPEEAPSG